MRTQGRGCKDSYCSRVPERGRVGPRGGGLGERDPDPLFGRRAGREPQSHGPPPLPSHTLASKARPGQAAKAEGNGIIGSGASVLSQGANEMSDIESRGIPLPPVPHPKPNHPPLFRPRSRHRGRGPRRLPQERDLCRNCGYR